MMDSTSIPTMVRLVILASTILVLSAASISAQIVAGRLEVHVVDETGVSLPGQSVRITNEDTGHSQERMTAKNGIALFLDVQPGSYTLDVNGSTKKGVQVLVAETRSVTIEIRPGILGALQVRITPANEERTELLSLLPNLNNDLTPLLQVVPGAVATGSSSLGKVVIDGKG